MFTLRYTVHVICFFVELLCIQLIITTTHSNFVRVRYFPNSNGDHCTISRTTKSHIDVMYRQIHFNKMLPVYVYVWLTVIINVRLI